MLWSQFPTGKLDPMVYSAFFNIFGEDVGWLKYNPWSPPVDSALVLNRPEVRNKKAKSLSYAYAREAKVRMQLLLYVITFFQVPYREVRYLAGAHAQSNSSDFGSLQPADPSFSGCSKCLSFQDDCEVKFISTIWITFSYDPNILQPQRCTKLSTSHWNGNVFRTGEYTATLEQLSPDERDQREEAMEEEEQAELVEQFGVMMGEVEGICKPRMIQHQIEKVDKEILKLKATLCAQSPEV